MQATNIDAKQMRTAEQVWNEVCQPLKLVISLELQKYMLPALGARNVSEQQRYYIPKLNRCEITHVNALSSIANCKDSEVFASQCPNLANYPGHCESNHEWTKKYCAKSCGWCCEYNSFSQRPQVKCHSFTRSPLLFLLLSDFF